LQAEQREAARKETVSRKRVRIVVWPMVLYFSFILSAGYYVYARIEHGMGGLTAGLRSYSYFVLFVEILGAVNMLFYACWLFARPVNTDVFPPANEKGSDLFPRDTDDCSNFCHATFFQLVMDINQRKRTALPCSPVLVGQAPGHSTNQR
jgi:hypothetical protein